MPKKVQKQIIQNVYWTPSDGGIMFDIEGMREDFESKLKKVTGGQYFR